MGWPVRCRSRSSAAGGSAYPPGVPNWDELQRRATERYEDGAARLPEDPDQRQRQLTRMANAAGAAALAELMAGLHREGFKQAIGSSAPYANLELILELTGIDRYLGAVELLGPDGPGVRERGRHAVVFE